jgi:hypothetical protein
LDAPLHTPVICRTIRVRVACDEEWRAKERWATVARGRLERASAVFEKRFALRWKAVDVVQWRSDDDAPTMRELIEQLERDVPLADVDVVVGFTGQTRAKAADRDYAQAGVAWCFGRSALVRESREGAPDDWYVGALAHELGHVMGAWHATTPDSVMFQSGGRTTHERFDAVSAGVIELCRDLDFARGVDWLDDTRRRRLRELYREGHASDSSLAYAEVVANRAWKEYGRSGDVRSLRAVLRWAVAEQSSCSIKDDVALAGPLRSLAWADLEGDSKDLDEAEVSARRAVALVTASGVVEEPIRASEALLASVLLERGRRSEAIVLLRKVYAARCAARGGADSDSAELRSTLDRLVHS